MRVIDFSKDANFMGGDVPTAQEINKTQGTRLSEKAPWETYSDEMDTKLSPELQEAVKRYEERKHERTSNEALEELARQKEINAALAKDYQWVKPEEYEYIAPRIGKIIHSSVFISQLKKLGLNVWYAAHPLPRRLKLIVDKSNGNQPPEFVCWLMEGFMPEYSIMKFDEHGIPLDERLRGWRTCLMQIHLKKLLTEEQITKEFGEAVGPCNDKYNSLFYGIRNKRIKAKEEE